MIKMCFSTLHTAEWLKWSRGLNCVTHISNPASSSSFECYFYTFFLRKSYVAQTDLELVTANLNFWSSFLYFLHPGIKSVNHHAQFMQWACRQNPGLCTRWTSTLPFNWENENMWAAHIPQYEDQKTTSSSWFSLSTGHWRLNLVASGKLPLPRVILPVFPVWFIKQNLSTIAQGTLYFFFN